MKYTFFCDESNQILNMALLCLASEKAWHPTPVLLPGKSMDRAAW